MPGNKKYYSNPSGMINIQCPTCEKTYLISVDKFKGKKNTVNIKCYCDNRFAIDIEFRKNFRKKVDFFGSYRLTSESTYNSKDCKIINLSLGGIGFKITSDSTLKDGDLLIIKFILDNKEKHEIERTIKIRYIDQLTGMVGGEFLYSQIGSYDRQIYYYLK